MIRKVYLIRALELNSPSILGMDLYTTRLNDPDTWYRRGNIDSVVIDSDFSMIVTIGVDQRDILHFDLGREVLVMDPK